MLVPLKLARGVDSLAFSSVGILMHDGDDFPTLGRNDCTSCDNRNVNNLVVVNALDINLTGCALDDTDVVSSNTTICAAINQCTTADISMGGRGVGDLGHVCKAVGFAIDRDLIWVVAPGNRWFRGFRWGKDAPNIPRRQLGAFREMCQYRG